MQTAKKKSFFVAVVCLILCVALLVGTTFAWFTDSVSNTGNRIQAGNLQIDLLKHNGTDYVSVANQTGSIFGTDVKWEPGQTQFAFLAVENKGNLALKYNTYIDVTDGGLVGSLEYALVPGSKNEIGDLTDKTWDDIKALTGAATGNVAEGRTTLTSGVLDEIAHTPSVENERDYVLLAVHMKEAAGNEYQNKNVVIDVTLSATQMTAEEDGFGSDQYDALASVTDPSVPIHVSVVTNNPVKEEATDTLTFTATGDVLGATLAKSSAQELFTNEEKTDASKDMLLNLNVDTTENTSTSVTYDLTLYKTITTTSGGVTTEGTPTKVTDTLNSYLAATIQLTSGLKNVTVTHSGNEMEKLASADAVPTNENGGYYYNSESGVLTIKSKSFSPFKVTYDGGIVVVHNETELNAALTNASLIKFANDIPLTNTVTIPENTSVSFDFNDYNLNFVNASGTQVLDHYIPAIYNLGTINKIENGTITIDGTWYAGIVNNGTIGTIDDLTVNTTTTSGHTVDVCAVANYKTINTINKVNATVCGSGVAGSIDHSSTGIYNDTGATISLIKNSVIAGTNTNNVGIENNGTIAAIEASTISSYDASTISFNKGINNKGTISLIKDSTIKTCVTGTNSGSASNNYAIYNQETLTKLENCSVYGDSTIASALYNQGSLGAITDGYFHGAVGGSSSKYIQGGYYSVEPGFAIRQTNYVAKSCSVEHDGLTFTYQVVEDAEAYQKEMEEKYCLKVVKNDGSYEMFSSFADAISYIDKNPSTCSLATLVMTKDISETTIEFMMSTFVYQLTLDLNGHTLSSNASAQQFINQYRCYLTVKDSSQGQTGKIVAGHNTYWSVFVQGNARFILESGTITLSNQCWSVVGFNGNGKFIIKGGTVNTSSAVYSALTYTYGGSPSCDISGGYINNNAPLYPKWSRSGSCAFTVTGGSFSSNMNPTSYVDTSKYDVTTVSGRYVVSAK